MRKLLLLGLIFLGLFYFENSASAQNRPPVAVAGPGQIIGIGPSQTIDVFLDGSASYDPEFQRLSFIWRVSNGAVVGNSALLLQRLHDPGFYIYTLTVSDGRGGTGSDSVAVILILDTTPPVVFPPSDITVNSTESGGAKGRDSSSLASFLAGGSATDDLDSHPIRMAPQVSGADVDNNTLFPEGTTAVAFRFMDTAGNVGTATANVIVVSHQDGDLFVGDSPIELAPSGATSGQIQRIRGGNLTDVCMSPYSTFDPAYWNIPTQVVMDTQGRAVFLASIANPGRFHTALMRCATPGLPPEVLTVLETDRFPGQVIPYGPVGLHIEALREIVIDPQVKNGLPQLVNEDAYVFGACLEDPSTGQRNFQTVRYHAALNTWEVGPDPGGAATWGCSGTNFDMISHSGATYIVGENVLRKIKIPLSAQISGTVQGVPFQVTLSLFGQASEIVGTVVDDLTVPDVSSGCDPQSYPQPPSLMMPYNGGFAPLAGLHDVLYDEFLGGGLVLASSYGPIPAVMGSVKESLLDNPTPDDYFWDSIIGCVPVPAIKVMPVVPQFQGALTNGVSTPNGLTGTDFWGGTVYRLGGPPNYMQPVASGLYHPFGLGAWPQKASAGLTAAILIRVDSPVDVLVTDPNGKRIGVLNGQPVNDFGTDGFDSGPGEPRFLAIKNPVQGTYAVDSVGTGDGPFTIHIYSANFSVNSGQHIETTGAASAGGTSKHDFTMDAAANIAFVNHVPTANAGPDQTVTATSPSGATVTLSGSAYDLDGDPLTFIWSGPFGSLTGAVITPTLPVGIHSITLTVDDGKGGIAKDTAIVTVNASALPTLSALITNKTGTQNARTWTVTLANSGAGPALNAQISGLVLTQTFGAACTPVITSPASFPLNLGDIPSGGSASDNVIINFNGCASTARFSANIPFSSNNGSVSGSKTLNNQYR